MLILRTVLVLFLAMILAGCGVLSAQDPAAEGPDVTDDTPSQREQVELDGTWRSTEVKGINLGEDTQVTITFGEDRFSADIACNTMTGPYEIEGGRLEVVYEAASETDMGCPQLGRSGDRWLLELLTSTPTIDQQEDVLTIIGDHDQLVLTRQDLVASDEEDRGAPDDADNPVSGPGVFPIIDVEVELYHCGFMPIDAAQTRWVPTDTPFDATNAPDSWVGRGRLLQGPDETLYADLSGIEVPMQELLGEFDPLLCQ